MTLHSSLFYTVYQRQRSSLVFGLCHARMFWDYWLSWQALGAFPQSHRAHSEVVATVTPWSPLRKSQFIIHPTKAAKSSPCGGFGGRSVAGTGFPWSTSVFTCQYHSIKAQYSFIHLSSTLHNVININNALIQAIKLINGWHKSFYLSANSFCSLQIGASVGRVAQSV